MPDPFAAAQIGLLRQAIAMRPQATGLRYDLAEHLLENGLVEEGVAEYLLAYRHEPMLRPHSIALGAADLAQMAPRTGLIAQHLLAHGVATSAVLLARAWSAAVLGEHDLVRFLINADRFLRVTSRSMPDLMTENFRRELVSEVEAGMQSYRLPWQEIQRADRNSAVLAAAAPLGSLLAARLVREVDSYAQGLEGLDHPFAQARPERYALQGWSVTFDGNSRHISHIHPHGWLSGVLYLDTQGLPPDDAQPAGWLRVGSPDGIAQDCGWPEQWIKPEDGKLVLFPSYFPHETFPLRGDGKRLCIAFDVVATDRHSKLD
jgi:hypothetical protein